jgi:succinate dehydrogenase / fumarate reductase cytochrome b subunit
VTKHEIDLPILHLPQLIGLAIGIEPKVMRLDHHVVSTKKLLAKLPQPAAV